MNSTPTRCRTTTRGDHSRKGRIVAAIVTAIAGLALTSSPAAAATGTPFRVNDEVLGSGSYYAGVATFSNRSVTVTGTLHAVGCRRVYAAPFAGSQQLSPAQSTSTHCNSNTKETFPLPANVRGGAQFVRLILTDANAQYGTGIDVYRS